jgi:hypothetical protein
MSKQVSPSAVMMFLNDLFARLDASLDVYGVHKVCVSVVGMKGVSWHAAPDLRPHSSSAGHRVKMAG